MSQNRCHKRVAELAAVRDWSLPARARGERVYEGRVGEGNQRGTGEQLLGHHGLMDMAVSGNWRRVNNTLSHCF